MAATTETARAPRPAVTDPRPQQHARRLWRVRSDGRGITQHDERSPRTTVLVGRGQPGAEAGHLWPRSLDWARLSSHDREVYEVGFLMGFLMREGEVEQANADADRYYRAAFDRSTSRARRR